MTEYHNPVMLHETVDGLNIRPDGIYVDVTFGGGGHSRYILSKLGDGGMLFAFDQDKDAVANAADFPEDKFTLIEGNFRYLKRYLKAHGIKQVDGVLGDLGISSYQINTPERGFSFRYDAPLDMRMDTESVMTAADVVNTYDVEDLHKIFGIYGEVKNAKTLAHAIDSARMNEPIKSTFQLKDILESFAPRGRESKYYAQVFQALRIEVNAELKALEEMLEQTAEVIKPGGRLSVMSYHSLEDRLLKNFIQKGKFHGAVEKDFYGNEIKPFKAVNRKPILASEQEILDNKRARSAKLRVAEKL